VGNYVLTLKFHGGKVFWGQRLRELWLPGAVLVFPGGLAPPPPPPRPLPPRISSLTARRHAQRPFLSGKHIRKGGEGGLVWATTWKHCNFMVGRCFGGKNSVGFGYRGQHLCSWGGRPPPPRTPPPDFIGYG
jgi:hypothetical protein